MCNPGYYFSENLKSCEKCGNTEDECELCSTDNKCLKCAKSSQYLDTKLNRCVDCSFGCKTCDTNGICLECQSGKSYDAVNNVCLDCMNDNRCLTCNFTNGLCLACSPGFFLEDRLCKPCSEGCSSCTGTQECDLNACDPGYWYDTELKACSGCGNKCTKCDVDTKKCLNCDSTTCLDAESGICEPMLPGCSKCASSS